MSTPAREIRFLASESSGEVSALLMRPRNAFALLVFGHGAGAGMRHVFMEEFAVLLAKRGVATFRYQFPYVEAGRRAPSPRPVLLKTVRAAVHAAGEAAPDLPRFAGGKSMGGRMTSMAAAAESLPKIRGLVFVGFPLHPAGRESTDRGDHLADVLSCFCRAPATNSRNSTCYGPSSRRWLVRPRCTRSRARTTDSPC